MRKTSVELGTIGIAKRHPPPIGIDEQGQGQAGGALDRNTMLEYAYFADRSLHQRRSRPECSARRAVLPLTRGAGLIVASLLSLGLWLALASFVSAWLK
jgi:hypothetical protein